MAQSDVGCGRLEGSHPIWGIRRTVFSKCRCLSCPRPSQSYSHVILAELAWDPPCKSIGVTPERNAGRVLLLILILARAITKTPRIARPTPRCRRTSSIAWVARYDEYRSYCKDWGPLHDYRHSRPPAELVVACRWQDRELIGIQKRALYPCCAPACRRTCNCGWLAAGSGARQRPVALGKVRARFTG